MKKLVMDFSEYHPVAPGRIFKLVCVVVAWLILGVVILAYAGAGDFNDLDGDFKNPSIGNDVNLDYSYTVQEAGRAGRQNDPSTVTRLQNIDEDHEREIVVRHNGVNTYTNIPTGGSALVVTAPGLPNGQPIIILQRRGE